MKEWKNSRGVLLLLLATTAIVWGLLVFRLSESEDSVSSTEAAREIPRFADSSTISPAASQYEADFRDPFRHQLDASGEWKRADLVDNSLEKEGERSPQREREESTPRVGSQQSALVGIIGETAMLKQPSGSVRFAKTGENVAGQIVHKIASDHVLLFQKEGGKVDTLKLGD